jgi:hypothetical protein
MLRPQNEQECPFDERGIRTTEYVGNDHFAAIQYRSRAARPFPCYVEAAR